MRLLLLAESQWELTDPAPHMTVHTPIETLRGAEGVSRLSQTGRTGSVDGSADPLVRNDHHGIMTEW